MNSLVRPCAAESHTKFVPCAKNLAYLKVNLLRKPGKSKAQYLALRAQNMVVLRFRRFLI